MDLYEQIKERNLKQNELIDELKYAQQVENGEITHELKKESGRDYDPAMHETERGYFHLIDIKKAKIIISGHITRLNSYCRIRGIKHEQIKYTGII